MAKLAANSHWRTHGGHKTTFAAETRKTSKEAYRKLIDRGLKVALIRDP